MTAMKTCPFCAEEVKVAAVKCKHCQSPLEILLDLDIPPEEPSPSIEKNSRKDYVPLLQKVMALLPRRSPPPVHDERNEEVVNGNEDLKAQKKQEIAGQPVAPEMCEECNELRPSQYYRKQWVCARCGPVDIRGGTVLAPAKADRKTTWLHAFIAFVLAAGVFALWAPELLFLAFVPGLMMGFCSVSVRTNRSISAGWSIVMCLGAYGGLKSFPSSGFLTRAETRITEYKSAEMAGVTGEPLEKLRRKVERALKNADSSLAMSRAVFFGLTLLWLGNLLAVSFLRRKRRRFAWAFAVMPSLGFTLWGAVFARPSFARPPPSDVRPSEALSVSRSRPDRVPGLSDGASFIPDPSWDAHIENYPNGQIKVSSYFAKGNSGKEILVGPDSEWYENGQKKHTRYFTNGKQDGLATAWHENGVKQQESNWQDDKRHGLTTEWHENGQMKSMGTFRNGKEYGLITIWHENGAKRQESNWQNGKQHGLATIWHETGSKQKEVSFREGKPHGGYIFWYETGSRQEEGTYRDGKVAGLVVEWHETGGKKSELMVRAGEIDGVARHWYVNGQLADEANYKNDELVGQARCWLEDGQEAVCE